jgi:regulatory protein
MLLNINVLTLIGKRVTLYKQRPTLEQALQKAKHFCSYQERCHSEVKEKLYSFFLKKHEVELLISQLIEADYLNEERFAVQFAGGKFRLKQWGRQKIKYELKQKQVGDYLIAKALKEITEDDYQKTLLRLAEQKWNSLKGEQVINRQVKTQNFLVQRGYELPLIAKAIQEIRHPENQ